MQSIDFNEDVQGPGTIFRRDPENPTLHFAVRQLWDALPPRTVHKRDAPYDLILITHSKTHHCKTKQECIPLIQDIQFRDMDTGARCSDIKYNFLIGEDGLVYEGRGWFEKPEGHQEILQSHPDCKELLTIAYLGNMKGEKPNAKLQDIAMDLIDYGIRNNIIQSDHVKIEDWN